MNSGSTQVDEPAFVDELRARSDQIRAALVAASKNGSGLRRLVGAQALVAELAVLQPRAVSSCRITQPRYFFDPEDPGFPLVRRSRERGVEIELITTRASVRTHPLLPSLFPRALVGPTFLRSLVVDDRVLVVEGRHDAEGERTSWVTEIPALVGAVVELWRLTLTHCVPVLPEGTPPPLTERQLEVARLVAVGDSDATIAHALHLSGRTVEREVAAVLVELGARNRTEAVLLMRGRGVNGGRPGS